MSMIALVIWISACEGEGSPEGWLCNKLEARSNPKNNDLSYRQKNWGIGRGSVFSGSIVTNLFVHTESLSAIDDPTKSRFPREHRLLEGSPVAFAARNQFGRSPNHACGRTALPCLLCLHHVAPHHWKHSCRLTWCCAIDRNHIRMFCYLSHKEKK